MTYCLKIVTSVVLLSSLCSGSDCTEKKSFGAGHIEDIKLQSSESQALVLQLNNGVYDYCRNLNLQTNELTFEEVACAEGIREWGEFPEYDISIAHEDAQEFIALNASAKQEYIEDVEDTALAITIGETTSTLTLPDTFIHPTAYSYFYAPSVTTLFIFTADQNKTALSLDDYTYVNLVTISWDPTKVLNIFPTDIQDFQVGTNLNAGVENMVGDAVLITLVLDGKKWTVYDDDSLFIVRINSVIAECEPAQWLRYQQIPDIYKMRKNGNDNHENGTFLFDYAGAGYMGVDTRVWRAYGFTGHEVWYFEAFGEGFDEFDIIEYEFDHQTLSSYWAVMWFGIALVVVICCCCVCMHVNKKRNQHEQGGMTDEQKYMTSV
eukprot:230724_1